MLGAIIGGAAGLAGSIVGGVSAAQKRRQMESYLNQQEEQNKAWYNSNVLSDYTQRADAQNLMRQLRETLGKRTKAAANTAVVTGATPEQQAIEKEAANKAISNTYANIGAMGQRWKDNVTNQYLARKQNIADQRMGMMGSSASSYENLMGSGLNLLGGSLGGILNGVSIGG